MNAYNILNNSFFLIKDNIEYYKKEYYHQYYSTVDDEEISFIDHLFGTASSDLSPSEKMLVFSVSAMSTATAILVEGIKRNAIKYTDSNLDSICRGYTRLNYEEYILEDSTMDEMIEKLFSLLTDGIDLDSRKKSGSERTPNDIINYMLDMIGYQGEDILNKKITDPACGTGTFVAQIVERLIHESKNCNISMMDRLLTHECINAYDTKPSNVFITKVVITLLLINHGCICEINDIVRIMDELPVYCSDYLSIHDKVDYVIGNPPYIRLHNLSSESRKSIKESFESATGRFDIYTCFLENGDKNLNPGGRMCLITSNKYLTANYGVGLRNYLSRVGHVRKIVDLFDTKFFGAAVLPVITLCENTSEPDCDVEYIGVKSSQKDSTVVCSDAKELFDYIERYMCSNKDYIRFDQNGDRVFEVSKSTVTIPSNGKTWNFSSDNENGIKHYMDSMAVCRLSDLMEICVGIKTTADTVFVKPMTAEFVEKMSFEQDVIYPLIQSFDVEKWKITWGNSKRDRYILYPHREELGNMEAIPLEDIPNAAAYLNENADTLKKRTYLLDSKTRSWYECWVPQKLSKFKQMKLVTRDIVSHNSFAYDAEGRLCQGNTFFLIKKGNSIFNMAFAELSDEDFYYFILGLLNSHAMEYYQKMISGCLYSQKYRYTSSNLNRWPIPNFDIDSAISIANLVRQLMTKDGVNESIEMKINDIVNEKFGFSDSDIDYIEDFIQVAV